MIHLDNVPYVLKYGVTHKNSKNSNTNFVPIGDQSLIDHREKKMVFIQTKTKKIKRICLGDFTPFYFGVRMPMLYVMQQGGNFVKKATSPENIIYLVCSVPSIIRLGNTCYFSDGHGTDSFSEFYDKTYFEELLNIIDEKAITTKYWSGQENLDLKRKKQAEFLVSGDLPPNQVLGFVCYNKVAKEKLIQMGIKEKQIRTAPKCYY